MDVDPDTERVLASLSRLGAGYEPDVTRLRRNIERRRRPATAPSHNIRSVLFPAAAVLLVTGGMVLIASGGKSGPDPASSPQPASIGVSTSSPSLPSRPDSTTGSKADETGSFAAGSTRDAAGDKGHETVGPKRLTPSASANVKAVSESSTTSVTLDGSSTIDWLAAGARSDLTVVRAKNAAAHPLLSFNQPSDTSAVPGPFRVSWSGGMPEQSHTAADTWLRRKGTGGMSVSVAPSPRPRTVTFDAGTSDLAATIRVSGGAVLAPTSLGKASGSLRAVVITLRLPPTTTTVTIKLGGTATGDHPLVFLSTVAVLKD